MSVVEHLSTVTEACRRKGPQDKIVMSSRVRLARNLTGYSFPGWAKKEERNAVLELIRPAVQALPGLGETCAASMDQLPSLEKQILVERHLISREHAAKGAGSGVVINKEENFSVMINEEDHLRIQILRPGLQIKEAWQKIDGLDTELETSLPYAFSNEWGYKTACPTNLGTAIRVSAMLHLPGLVLAEQINPIIQAVGKLGLAVRGLYGEGTEALGNVFQVSNQMTLGESEEDIVERLNKVVLQMIEHEENARATLLEKKPKYVLNQIGRAYGILGYAHSLASKETLNLLSMMRLGYDLELFPEMERSLIDELFITTQPAHLQFNHPGKLSTDARDYLRADILRERIRDLPSPQHQILTSSAGTSTDAQAKSS